MSAFVVEHRDLLPRGSLTPSQNGVALASFVGIAFLAALPSAGLDLPATYESLTKPDWAPPGWLFGPVWTLLYVMIGAAAWGVWQRTGWSRPLVLWAIQLVLNAAWTPIFFGLHQPAWALLEIIVLWLAIVSLMVVFSPVAKWTAWLLAPYLAWVTFAAGLNAAIWLLNP